MFRAIITVIVVVLFVTVTLPYVGIEFFLGKISKTKSTRRQASAAAWVLNVISKLSGARVTFTGTENIPADGKVMFCANHSSYFDIILMYSMLPRPTGFIIKEDLKKLPLIGMWMSRIGCFFISRDDPRKAVKTITEASDTIKDGIGPVFIFPEGTRSKDGQLHEFHTGSFKVASRAKCPVIPVAITGTRAIWEDHPKKLVPGDVTFSFGEPVDIGALSPEEKKHIGAYMQGVVSGMLEKSRS